MKNQFKIEENMVKIMVKQRDGDTYTVLIDIDDLPRIGNRAICVHGKGKKAYAVINIGGKSLQLHRYLLRVTDPKILVDHINGNKMDNRKEWLRETNSLQNLQNRHTVKSNSVSGKLGVNWDKDKNMWVARVSVNGISHFLGRYHSIEDASEAVTKFRAEHLPYAKEAREVRYK